MTEDSALAKPFRNIFRFFGAFVDAVYYFVDSLFNPGTSSRNSRGRLLDSSRSPGVRGPNSGPRIGTLRPQGSEASAPNMSFGGCRSCM